VTQYSDDKGGKKDEYFALETSACVTKNLKEKSINNQINQGSVSVYNCAGIG